MSDRGEYLPLHCFQFSNSSQYSPSKSLGSLIRIFRLFYGHNQVGFQENLF